MVAVYCLLNYTLDKKVIFDTHFSQTQKMNIALVQKLGKGRRKKTTCDVIPLPVSDVSMLPSVGCVSMQEVTSVAPSDRMHKAIQRPSGDQCHSRCTQAHSLFYFEKRRKYFIWILAHVMGNILFVTEQTSLKTEKNVCT